MLSSQSGELSFMRIYGQRAQVPGSIIIDGMLCYCCSVQSEVFHFVFHSIVLKMCPFLYMSSTYAH